MSWFKIDSDDVFIIPPANMSPPHIYYRALSMVNPARTSVHFVVPSLGDSYQNLSKHLSWKCLPQNSPFSLLNHEWSDILTPDQFIERLKRPRSGASAEIVFISPVTEHHYHILNDTLDTLKDTTLKVRVRLDIDEDYGILPFELSPHQYHAENIDQETFKEYLDKHLLTLLKNVDTFLHKSGNWAYAVTSPSEYLLYLLKCNINGALEDYTSSNGVRWQFVPNKVSNTTVLETLGSKVTKRLHFMASNALYRQYTLDKESGNVKNEYSYEIDLPQEKENKDSVPEKIKFKLVDRGEDYESLGFKNRFGVQPRILVSGLAHEKDFRLLPRIIKKFRELPEGKESLFIFMGDLPPQERKDHDESPDLASQFMELASQNALFLHPPVEFPEYYSTLLELDANIGLVLLNPLHPFNYTKSTLKTDEYRSMGLFTISPTIAISGKAKFRVISPDALRNEWDSSKGSAWVDIMTGNEDIFVHHINHTCGPVFNVSYDEDNHRYMFNSCKLDDSSMDEHEDLMTVDLYVKALSEAIKNDLHSDNLYEYPFSSQLSSRLNGEKS